MPSLINTIEDWPSCDLTDSLKAWRIYIEGQFTPGPLWWLTVDPFPSDGWPRLTFIGNERTSWRPYLLLKLTLLWPIMWQYYWRTIPSIHWYCPPIIGPYLIQSSSIRYSSDLTVLSQPIDYAVTAMREPRSQPTAGGIEEPVKPDSWPDGWGHYSGNPDVDGNVDPVAPMDGWQYYYWFPSY